MRLCVLMIEVKPAEGVSARKLVLETSDHNVITAYKSKVGLELLLRFPNVDAVVVHTLMQDMPFPELVRQIKAACPGKKIIAVSPLRDRVPDGADYVIDSYQPQELLQLLAERFEASTSN